MLYIAAIETSFVDGPGARAVIRLQGCPIRCPKCQNKALWEMEEAPIILDPVDAAGQLLANDHLPITITGGEPMLQADEVKALIAEIKIQDPAREVLVYSGHTIEDLLEISEAIPAIGWILAMADILVDGPYEASEDDDSIQYRGSRNQRVIDLQATIRCNGDLLTAYRLRPETVELVLLDWDTPTLTITPDGEIVGAARLIHRLFGATAGRPIRRCGEAI
jgi:anaerobic ribonucleoside-triphosphate reductase activating protein